MKSRGIPRGTSPSFPERVREHLETLLGVRGNSLDAAVTYRDLIDSGYALPSGIRSLAGSGGGGANPLAPGPVADRTPPPKAVAPQANDAIGTTTLTWGIPDYGNHAFSEIWRASVDDLSQAVLFARTPGQVGIYTAPLDYGETWYFWIRLVSTAEVAGPWHATPGLQAVGATNVSAVLASLSDEIDSSSLSQALNDKLAEINGIQSQVNDLSLASAGQTFVEPTKPMPGVGDTPDPIPTNARWFDEDDNNHPYIWAYRNVRSSEFAWIDPPGPGAGAGVYRLEDGLGGAPSVVEPDAMVQFDGTDETTLTRVADNTLVLSEGEWSWVNDGALGGFTVYIRIAGSVDPDTLANGYLRLYAWRSLRDPRVGQNESDITALQVSVGSIEDDVTASATAIDTLGVTVTGQGNDIVSLSTRTTSLESSVNDSSTGLATKASLTQLAQTQSDILGSSVSLFTEIDARFTSVDNDVSNRATITQLSAVSADLDTVEAKWGIDLDVNGYVVGLRLNNDGATGSFVVRADKFIVGNPGDNNRVPFAVIGNSVFLSTAAIQNASITDAKIGSLSASKITAGSMSADRISGGTISGNNVNVTNLNADNISAGTLNADRIQLDNLTLDTSAGKLVVKNGGVDTGQIAANAVNKLGEAFVGSQVTTSSTVTWATAVSDTVSTSGSPVRVSASAFYRRTIGGDAQRIFIKVTRNGVDISNSSSVAFRTDPSNDFNSFSITVEDSPGSGTHTYKIEFKSNNGATVGLTSSSLVITETKR